MCLIVSVLGLTLGVYYIIIYYYYIVIILLYITIIISYTYTYTIIYYILYYTLLLFLHSSSFPIYLQFYSPSQSNSSFHSSPSFILYLSVLTYTYLYYINLLPNLPEQSDPARSIGVDG
jgi:hypothetical protein